MLKAKQIAAFLAAVILAIASLAAVYVGINAFVTTARVFVAGDVTAAGLQMLAGTMWLVAAAALMGVAFRLLQWRFRQYGKKPNEGSR